MRLLERFDHEGFGGVGNAKLLRLLCEIGRGRTHDFFTDDALYVDGPRGVHRGIDAIRAEFEAIVQIVPSTTVDIKALVANGGTVMVERVDNFEIGGKPFDLEVVGVFDVDDNGRITRWHDYYDLRSSEERIAAGLAAQSR